jgi:uncharacterized protein (DUF58 family)
VIVAPLLLLALLALVAVAVGLGAAPVLPTTRAALLAAAVLAGALVVPITVVEALAVVLGGAVVADAALARQVPEVDRRCRARLVRGSPSPLVVRIAGAGPGTVRVRQPRAAEVTVDPPEGDGRLDAAVVALRRGHHALAPVALRVTGPLGLAAWYRQPGEGQDVVVLPDVPGAMRIATAVRRGRFRDSGELTRGPLGLGTDFESIRDYQPDDDIRQVNWPATQRSGRPMSNQYRVEQDRTVIGLLDAGRLTAAPVGDRTRLDAILDAFVAVAYVADELGDRVGVVAFAETILRERPPRRRGAEGVVRSVYDLEPHLVDADYRRAFRRVGGGKRSLVVVGTDLLDEAAAAELVDALPVITRRHAVMVVSAVDTDVEALLHTPPTEPSDVYRAAAAADLLAPRRAVVHRLRRLGVLVVEARPSDLPAATVRAYLRAKSRSVL